MNWINFEKLKPADGLNILYSCYDGNLGITTWKSEWNEDGLEYIDVYTSSWHGTKRVYKLTHWVPIDWILNEIACPTEYNDWIDLFGNNEDDEVIQKFIANLEEIESKRKSMTDEQKREFIETAPGVKTARDYHEFEKSCKVYDDILKHTNAKRGHVSLTRNSDSYWLDKHGMTFVECSQYARSIEECDHRIVELRSCNTCCTHEGMFSGCDKCRESFRKILSAPVPNLIPQKKLSSVSPAPQSEGKTIRFRRYEWTPEELKQLEKEKLKSKLDELFKSSDRDLLKSLMQEYLNVTE